MPPASRTVDWREALTALAALETGLLAGFRGGATPQDAARAAGLDDRAARIVAAALADQGLLEPVGDGVLRTTARGDALLAPAADGTDPAGALHLEVRAIRSHLALADVLRGGLPPDDVSAGDPDTRERFMRAMRDVTAPRIPAVLAAVGPPPRPGGRMLDVGGAPGVHARAFAGDGMGRHRGRPAGDARDRRPRPARRRRDPRGGRRHPGAPRGPVGRRPPRQHRPPARPGRGRGARRARGRRAARPAGCS